MNIKVNNLVVILLSILFIFFMVTSNNEVIESVSFSISLWKDNLFPTLFPFFFISNILIDYNFIDIISFLLKDLIEKTYKLPKECGFVLAISLISGFPSGAKYTNELVNKKIINKEIASKLLTFTHYSNPLFILGFISLLLNKKIAILIFISHIISGLLTGLFFNRNNNYINNNKTINKYSYYSFGYYFQKSIKDSIDTLLLILGIITIFSIISSLINTYIKLPNIYNYIITGLLEMSQGIKRINELNINLYIKTILTTLFISFGGLSVHLQVISIISENKIKYKYFLQARIIHSILAIILVSILYYFIS